MAGRFIRNLGAVNIGIVLVFLVSGRLSSVLLSIGLLAALVGLVFTALAWWRFVFTVDGDELHVRKGVVAEERLTIPLDRVQSVSIHQRSLHRLVGLVSVSVDTAGSASAELEIDAVERNIAEALQRVVAGHRKSSRPGVVGVGPVERGGEAAAEIETVIVRRTFGDLVRIGATRWPWAGLVALAPLVALLDDVSDFLPGDLVDEEQLVENNIPAEVGSQLVVFLLLGLLVAVAIGALLGTALQIVREVVTNWDMQLLRTSTGFRRTSGLLSTTSRASTIQRIQAVQTDQTPAQRLFGIRKLTLPTIGEGDLSVPGATEEELAEIRSIVFGSPAGPPLDRMISPLSIFLAVRNRVLTTVPLTAIAVLTVGWWGLVVLAAVPLQWLIARRRWRLRRWGLSRSHIAESYELVNRHTAELEMIKAQTVSVRRSLFERRRGLATVRIETAEGYLAVPLIPVIDANSVRDRVLYTVESNRRAWM